jgi:hypothetical protein
MSTETSEAMAAWLLETKLARETSFARRKASKAGFIATFKRRRDAGLKHRHAEKSARTRAGGTVV